VGLSRSADGVRDVDATSVGGENTGGERGLAPVPVRRESTTLRGMNIRERHPVPSPRPAARADPPQLPVRRLVQFGALCLVLSWVPWSVLGALGADVDEGLAALVFGLAASGPSLAALTMWLLMRRERSGGPRRSGTRLSWGWPVAAIVLGAAPPLVAAVVLGLDDLGAIPLHVASVAAGVGGPLGVLAYTLVSGPLAEEFGWRGFVQPRLRLRYGRVRTAVVLAIAWGLWHVPLFFLTGTGQHAKGLFSLQGAMFFAALFPLCYTILFVTEHLRGGVWAAVLVHAAWNASDALLPAHGDAGASVQAAVALAVAVAVAIVWRARIGGQVGAARSG
jgi:membrane protease YdiL (CAAX protease family)